jgi:GNAT superfamily N-acetyltransferase
VVATSTDFFIRPLELAHLDAWLALRNQAFPWPVDRARFLYDESLRPSHQAVLQLGAWTAAGELAGTAECHLGEAGERYVSRAESFVMVALEHRRRGLGGRLVERIERFALDQEIRWLEALFYERDAALTQPFLERRGFKDLERYQESWQEPASVSLDRLAGLRAGLRASGIETTAFSAIDSDVMRHALYRCAMAIQRDMPHAEHSDWEDPPFEAWMKKVLQAPGSSAEGMFVARDGDLIVGLTYLVERGNGEAEVGDTGVIRSHRRRGIARVLKLMATQHAAERAIRRVQTDNRVDNVGMIAINRELGFRPGDSIRIFEKTLRRASGDNVWRHEHGGAIG